MATKLRLTRHGSKKRPSYRIVAASSGAPRDGRFIEQLGHYDPTSTPPVIHLKLDKVDTWMRRGAQPSETVARLMKKAGWKPSGSSAKAPDAASEG